MPSHQQMKEITKAHLSKFLKTHRKVAIGNAEIRIGQPKKIKEYQPKEFELERTNTWSFPDRGKWATHQGNFRGNWPPQLARNVILRYSKPKETVLDQMCGSGTTLIECKLLGRNTIGVDINPECIMLTRDRLNFDYCPALPGLPKVSTKTYVGDARNLNLIDDNTIDLVATHPPYANIIAYSNRKKQVSGDLSFAHTFAEYLAGLKEMAKESYRVLKPDRFCVVLVGDTRKHRHHVPVAFKVMEKFLEVGFVLREDIIKHQWKTKTTREKWEPLSKVAEECWIAAEKGKKHYTDFYLLSYEHLFVFRKLGTDEETGTLMNSMEQQSCNFSDGYNSCGHEKSD